MKKKLFSIILSFIMVATMMPIMTSTAFAVEGRGFESDPWILSKAGSGESVKAYIDGYKLVITGEGVPDSIMGVTSLPWYSQRDRITQLVVEEGVVRVPDFACCSFKKLERVTLASTVRYLGTRSLVQCPQLKNITIPKGLVSISINDFQGDDALEWISVNSNNAKYTAQDGVLYSKDMKTLIFYPPAKNAESFTIPSSVTKIDSRACRENSYLKTITIPEESGTVKMENYAFDHCRNLTKINIETSNMPTIDSTSFSSCNVNEINVPKGTAFKYREASGWSEYADIINKDEPDGPPKIEKFYTNSFYSVLSINELDRTQLSTTFVFTVTNEGTNEVSMAVVQSGATFVPELVSIPAVIGIHDEKLGIDVDFQVTSIADRGFYNCNKIKTLRIAGLFRPFNIGTQAFGSCSNLSEVIVETDPIPSLAVDAFTSCNALKEIKVPSNQREVYLRTPGWSNYERLFKKDVVTGGKFYSSEYFGNISQNSAGKFFEFTILDVDAHTVSIGTVASAGSVSNSITIPETISYDGVYYKIKEIAENGFLKKTGFRSISIPNSIEKINNGAFDGCSNLTSVSLPSGLTNIGANVFRDCKSLTNIILPSGITAIDSSAFQNCESLTSIVIPASIRGIGKYAFNSCSKLKSVTINAVVPPTENTPYMAFKGCDSALKIYVPYGSLNMYISDPKWGDYEDMLAETKTPIDPTIEKKDAQSLKDEEARLKQEEERLKQEAERLKQEEARIKSENEAIKAETERLKKENEEALAKLKEEQEKLKEEQERQKNLTEEEKEALRQEEEERKRLEEEARLLEEKEKKEQAKLTKEEQARLKKEQEAKLSAKKVKEFVNDMTLVVRTASQPRGIYVHVEDGVSGLKEIKNAGYRVVYDFYSTQQNISPADAKFRLTKVYGKTEPWYLNTAAKKGMRYYYKTTIRVIDAEGTVIAKTTLSQAEYGYRTRR